MPLSANFRREMLMAIKNAKKKKEGDEAQIEHSDEEATSDVVRYNSKILAKPAISHRDLRVGTQAAAREDGPNSGQASVDAAKDEQELPKK